MRKTSLVMLGLSLFAFGAGGCSKGDSPSSSSPALGSGGIGAPAPSGGSAGTSPGSAGAAQPTTPSAGAGGLPSSEGIAGQVSIDPVAQEPAPAAAEPLWVGTWATGPQLTEPANLPPAPGLAGNTLRQKVFATLSGARVRVLFSNEWGEAPVTFDAVRIAAAAGASAIDPSTDRGLLFGGAESVTIPAGQTQVSDPIDFPVAALSSLAVSIRFGSAPTNVTGHPGSRTTSYLQGGDAVSAASLDAAATTDHWYFVTGIDVEVQPPSSAIVALGDSITDGRGSTTNANDRWPDQLARRLQGDPSTDHLAVLNQGIGGNAVLTGGLGPTAIDRFERDVLEQRGARWVVVLEGVNDIGGSADASVGDRLITAFEGLIDRAQERGLLVYGVPILPFGGSSYDSPAHEQARQTVNAWVRTSGRFDAVIDLDAAVADPASPNLLQAAYDSGDHLHLSPAGYRAMADAIDLTLFAE